MNSTILNWFYIKWSSLYYRLRQLLQIGVTLLQSGLGITSFWGCSRIRKLLGPKICYLKSITRILIQWNWQSYILPKVNPKICINHVTHHFSSTDISIFSREISIFRFVVKLPLSYAGSGELVKSIVGQNFEKAMFFYVLKQEIVYLLQALWQLVASCLADLSILIQFQNHSEMALFFFVMHY